MDRRNPRDKGKFSNEGKAARVFNRAQLILVLLIFIATISLFFAREPLLRWHARKMEIENIQSCLDYTALPDQAVFEWFGDSRQFNHQPPPFAAHLWVNDETSNVFLHQRISPAGHARLVLVFMYNAIILEGKMRAQFFPRVCNMAKLSAAQPLAPADYTPSAAMQLMADESTVSRVFAGQPDPNDASHFVITFSDRGRPRHIEGWLGDDDHVLLKSDDSGEAVLEYGSGQVNAAATESSN